MFAQVGKTVKNSDLGALKADHWVYILEYSRILHEKRVSLVLVSLGPDYHRLKIVNPILGTAAHISFKLIRIAIYYQQDRYLAMI